MHKITWEYIELFKTFRVPGIEPTQPEQDQYELTFPDGRKFIVRREPKGKEEPNA